MGVTNLKRYSLLLIPLAVWMVGFWNPLKAYIAWPAGSGFEITPSGSDSVAQGDDRIREFKEQVRLRAQVEHHWGTSVSSADNGRHREGSAVAWDEAACPTGNVTGDPATGTTAYGATDDGRLCRDSTTGELKMWTGAAYVTVPTASSGDGSNHFNLLSGVTFQKAGTDAMDIHAHAARHKVNGADLIKNLIASVTYNKTATTGAVSDTLITSQTFVTNSVIGSSMDFTGRGGSSSQYLVYWNIVFNNVGAATCMAEARAYAKATTGGLVSAATALGTLQSSGTSSNSSDGFTLSDMIFVGGAGSTVWNVAIHADDQADNGCTVQSGSITLIDLGTE